MHMFRNQKHSNISINYHCRGFEHYQPNISWYCGILLWEYIFNRGTSMIY